MFFALIILSNLAFFLYWGYKMYMELKQVMLKKIEKLYLCLCVCMDKGKLEKDKEACRIAEENELLREDYMKCNIPPLNY